MTDGGQLTLDGGEVPVAESREKAHGAAPLTPAQLEVMRHLGEHGTIRTVEAGVVAHRHRGRCARGGTRQAGFKGGGVGCCGYAAVDGLELMKRLARRGLVQRTEWRGVWGLPGA